MRVCVFISHLATDYPHFRLKIGGVKNLGQQGPRGVCVLFFFFTLSHKASGEGKTFKKNEDKGTASLSVELSRNQRR